MQRKCLLLIFSALVLFSACDNKSPHKPSGPEKRITILYTNDEHGWMQASENQSGAAGLMALWKEQEGYTEDGPFLILSGGDMWTGPAISTWFKGESMADVLNAMHYDAAAIGNHEFDFKIPELQARIVQSEFPLLAANIREKSNGLIPDYIQPYTIIQVDSVDIGIIGLSTITTPYSTFPTHVEDYDFIPYVTALEETVPQVKSAGAKIIIVLGHLCEPEMRQLVDPAKQLGISLITGGHCWELVSDVIDGIGLIKTSAYLEYYGRVDMYFDAATGELQDIEIEIKPNQTELRDAQVSAVVSYWEREMDATLSEVIGYTQSGIERWTAQMENMVMDSWLLTFPEADAALSNAGGIRQDIPPGDITLGTIVGLLPFENLIMELNMSGAEIQAWAGNFIHSGLRGKNPYFFADSTTIINTQIYKVLTTDYLYSRVDIPFQSINPQPYSTAVHYRQPVIDWIKSLNTSATNPLDNYLDYENRK
ncbi:bifunctional metallophosphatase/5'-nucleotidase [candidate division KSB1 bacterium]|nr:bifunctional metallophosphatase/5'-nucleotidase [candidate division KSB1 bacterium]